MNEENFGERIRKAAELIGGQLELSRRTGISSTSINKYVLGESDPSRSRLVAIAKATGVNVGWLAAGEGPMEREAAYIYMGEGKTAGRGEGGIEPPPGSDPSEFDLVPMVETRLSAGNGCFVLSENVEGYYAFRKSWVRSVAASARDLVLMRVDGDSMNPTIRSGDTVMIDASRRTIIEGQVFALRVDDTIMIKRLSYRPGGRVLVGSDNRQEFDPYEVDLADLHVLGQIIFFSRVLINI